jgi:hypothetical protein
VDGTGETAAQRVTDLEAQLVAARQAAEAEAAAGAPTPEVKDAATEAAKDAGATDAQAEQAAAQAVAQTLPGGAPAAPLTPPAAAPVAPGDGTRPQDGQAGVATAEGTGAVQAAPAADAVPEHKPVLELIKELGPPESPHGFIENLRTVAQRLETDGRLVVTDIVGGPEANKLTATLVKVVGELVSKL